VRTFRLLTSIVLILASGCRTVGDGASSGELKQVSETSVCDPKNILAELSPGGLYATKRVLYNQPGVEKEWIHPVMIEKSSSGNFGLFHNFIPDTTQSKKIKKINAALAALTKQVSAINAVESKVSGDVVKLKGGSDRLNVFKVDGQVLLGAKEIEFDVSSKASNIVILAGQTPALNSVSIVGDVSPEKLLFVLPNAGTFRVQGEKFFGTVIAPDTAVFMESSFTGSIYAGEVSVREPMNRSFYTGCLK
jgi:choice-of-anchor A domain-containing protein